MSIDSLYVQRSQKENEMSAANTTVYTIEEKLAEIMKGKQEIAQLKDQAIVLRNQFSMLKHEQHYDWFGNNQVTFAITHYGSSHSAAAEYYNALDDLADQLVEEERRLNDERYQYCILIERLHDSIAWITSEIQKAFN